MANKSARRKHKRYQNLHRVNAWLHLHSIAAPGRCRSDPFLYSSSGFRILMRTGLGHVGWRETPY